MSISHYLKEIGRGKQGAKSLNSHQATDLMGLILDGQVSEIELGAFCLAMRIKGETPQEMAGFLSAIESRINLINHSNSSCTKAKAVVVIPSYNGARKLPLLTPLLAHLLSLEGFAVLIHGHSSEDQRITSKALFDNLNWPQFKPGEDLVLKGTEVRFIDTHLISPALAHLLSLRRIIGLRNSAHSLVKLLNPIQSEIPVILLTSFTHPEYALSMNETLKLKGQHALLLRGTEGEAVADARRSPKMIGLSFGAEVFISQPTLGSVIGIDLPIQIDPQSTANFIHSILHSSVPVPSPIQKQIEAVKQLSQLIDNSSHRTNS